VSLLLDIGLPLFSQAVHSHMFLPLIYPVAFQTDQSEIHTKIIRPNGLILIIHISRALSRLTYSGKAGAWLLQYWQVLYGGWVSN